MLDHEDVFHVLSTCYTPGTVESTISLKLPIPLEIRATQLEEESGFAPRSA